MVLVSFIRLTTLTLISVGKNKKNTRFSLEKKGINSARSLTNENP
jgi:hypothetical protein